MEERAQGQRRGDRQGRKIWLASGRGARFRPPCRDRLVREPDGQTTALSQCRIVFPPVRNPIATLRNVMAMIGVVFERHDGFPGTEWDHPAPTRLRPPTAARVHATPSVTQYQVPARRILLTV